jgi:hypothetical protein
MIRLLIYKVFVERVFIMRSLHNVREINASGWSVCLSVRMIQLENR